MTDDTQEICDDDTIAWNILMACLEICIIEKIIIILEIWRDSDDVIWWPFVCNCVCIILWKTNDTSEVISSKQSIFTPRTKVIPLGNITLITINVSRVAARFNRPQLTNLKEHQSNLNSASRKSISTLVLLKSLGHDGIFHSGFTSSCNSFNSCENGAVLPSLMTTLK